MGSRTLMVDESEDDLTMHSSILPRHMPLLKKDVCDDKRFPRFSAAVGSVGSRASRGNAVTLRSRFVDGAKNRFSFWHDEDVPARTISSWNSSRTSTCVTSGIATTLAGVRKRSSRRLLKNTPSSVPYIIRLPPSFKGSVTGLKRGRSLHTVRRCTVHLVQPDEESVRQRHRFEYATSVPEILLLFVNVLEPILPSGKRCSPKSKIIAFPAKVLYRKAKAVL